MGFQPFFFLSCQHCSFFHCSYNFIVHFSLFNNGFLCNFTVHQMLFIEFQQWSAIAARLLLSLVHCLHASSALCLSLLSVPDVSLLACWQPGMWVKKLVSLLAFFLAWVIKRQTMAGQNTTGGGVFLTMAGQHIIIPSFCPGKWIPLNLLLTLL
ncbi:hypothetical protein RchiOBHm_Chr1g0355611 [Rosa chinensis]|uniref:Uncharacterized protein n=1 Tax=Rosa chinensis TaxID=74649 RepID=A0A2P6SHF3_ROSCH|nr:hypothetical protein RchiOBHm_Chr1g0355611 [Rosa chinensis]